MAAVILKMTEFIPNTKPNLRKRKVVFQTVYCRKKPNILTYYQHCFILAARILKPVTNEPVLFSNDGVYFKNENKSTKKESGVSDNVLQGKNKHSDTLPTLSQSGSLDCIAVDENGTTNPGSFLNDGGYHKHKTYLQKRKVAVQRVYCRKKANILTYFQNCLILAARIMILIMEKMRQIIQN